MLSKNASYSCTTCYCHWQRSKMNGVFKNTSRHIEKCTIIWWRLLLLQWEFDIRWATYMKIIRFDSQSKQILLQLSHDSEPIENNENLSVVHYRTDIAEPANSSGHEVKAFAVKKDKLERLLWCPIYKLLDYCMNIEYIHM